MKRFLALILTGVMITSISVMAFAENAETEISAEEGIEAQEDGDDEETGGDGEETGGDNEETDGDNEETGGDGEETGGDGEETGGDDDRNEDDADIGNPDEGNTTNPDDSNGSNEGNKQISDLTTSKEDLKWLHDNYLQYPSNWEHIDSWKLPDGVLSAYIAMYGDPRGNSGSSDADEYQYDPGSEAEALAVEATGVSMTTFIGAATENKTIGEYMNNAVTAAPGLDNAIPVSQGGNVIINGVPSNQTFYVLKVLSGHTDSAKAHAASIGGKVLNVARIDARVSFTTATVNFYMPGVKSGQNIQVYQYNYTSGQWTSVTVAEVRNDHVVVDMTSLGVLAFIEVPAAQ